MNNFPNSGGIFLNLVFTSNIANVSVSQPSIYGLMDTNSIHHNAVTVQIAYDSSVHQLIKHSYDFFHMRLKDSKTDLKKSEIINIKQSDIDDATFHNGTAFIEKVNSITEQLFNIQCQNSRIKRVKHRKISPHIYGLPTAATKKNNYLRNNLRFV